VLLLFLVGEPEYAPLMVRSVKRHLPEYRIVQLTDFDSPEMAGADEVIRRYRDPDLPLFAFRTEHFALCPYTEWLALDADVLVMRGVEDVWERKFDVALTTRRKLTCRDPNGVDVRKSMPFNTGVIFSRNPEFWVKCGERMNHSEKIYADQLAVADVAQTLKFHVLVLPGDEFNWTPVTEDEHSEARIWHYKGKRKDWMMQRGSL
jgi:3-hydroxymyristoyl/3-hydroxydecanoyl-(acyl carrier protein) dehydratase